MNEAQKQTRKIDWQKSSRLLAQMVWGVGTYVALLFGVAWLSVAVGGSKPASVAVVAVVNCTLFHWIVFTVIERKSDN